MKKLRISIIDLIHNRPSQSLYRRFMFPNYASIMPQVIGVWCREEGHEVHYSIYTGTQKIRDLLMDKTDVVMISSFSFTAQLAYALSSYYRSQGIGTVLGGPHARSYPEDACLYFDYVLGLTDKELLRDLLHNFELNNPRGIYLSALSQPQSFPGVRERWEFIEQVHKSTSMIKEDLQFLIKKIKHPVVGWYDPNFGIRFNTIMETIESAVPPGSIKFIAECSLASLKEPNVKTLKRNGFIMIMLGIESWFKYGNKAKMESVTGMDKVIRVAEQVNMIQRYIPQVHANLMFGFESESGPDPFTLTKRFLDLAPGVYPAYALLTLFGQSTKASLKYEAENRIIPFPFHMMHGPNNLNVVPRNYSWEEFYSRFLDLLKYSFSAGTMYRRFKNNPMIAARWITLFLSFSVGGSGKIRQVSSTLENLRRKPDFRSFLKKETTRVPDFMIEKVKKDLGPMWNWLPDKTLSQKPNILLRPESL